MTKTAVVIKPSVKSVLKNGSSVVKVVTPNKKVDLRLEKSKVCVEELKPAENESSSWLHDEEAHQIVIPFQQQNLYLLAVGRSNQLDQPTITLLPARTLWVHWSPSPTVRNSSSLSSKHTGARICSYSLSQTQFEELEAVTGALSQISGTKKLQHWLRAFVADSTEREHTAFPRLIGQLF